ncbi:hypothetical protein C8R46DRAFT_1200689 [Mycena filopes]|nr:hypothetical protein C8R46DRAFT_1200689 [Mycena filopes]
METHHIVAMLPPLWGHTMLAKDPSLVLTIVQHNSLVKKMETELVGYSHDNARLCIVGTGEKECLDPSMLNLLDSRLIAASLPLRPNTLNDAIEQLVAGWLELLPKMAQGMETWPKPRVIHLDFFPGGFVIGPTKQIMGPGCKILTWWSSALAAMPTYLTGFDFAAITVEVFADEARRLGRSEDEILQQVAEAWNGTDALSGRIIKCPGVPDMYDYERVAHAVPPAPGIGHFFVQFQKLAKLTDGFIATTGSCIEPVAVPFCRELYRARGQELFTVGVQAHPLCWSGGISTISNQALKSFLDGALSQYGAKSVLYISFGISRLSHGSFFFPTATPQLIETLLDTLLALDHPFPFILGLGGQMASLPQPLIQRVNATAKGLICDFWVEQRAVLQHPPLGWFLTHGGFNSITEALTQGIPLIIWPTGAEQPVNAALLSAAPHPVAIELLQARALSTRPDSEARGAWYCGRMR